MSRKRLIFLSAASLALGVLIGFSIQPFSDAQDLHIQTQPRDMRAITLKDGTYLQIQENTDVRVKLSRSQRDASLVRGEVSLVVSPDSRPFVFEAPRINLRVREVSSFFGVRVDDEGTRVTLGKDSKQPIEVAYPDGNAKKTITLRPGETALASVAGPLKP